MKWLISIMITLLFCFALTFTANATENDVPSIPLHHHWDDGDDDHHHSSLDGGHHSGNFKVADLLDDEEGPEIILLKDATLTFMDSEGKVLLTKTVEGIEDNHGGWWFMPGHAHGNGEVGLEIDDLDEDGVPEIIILDTEKLIILNNNGDPKTTITLP
jgi:hypothetical protein